MPDQLNNILTLEPVGKNRYRCDHHLKSFRNSLFGGQVIAQALAAANLSCPDKLPHSLHAYFLRPGSFEHELFYEVKVSRQGRSFVSLGITATQNNKDILIMNASYHRPEQGFNHQLDARDLPLAALEDSVDDMMDTHLRITEREHDNNEPANPFVFRQGKGDLFSQNVHEQASSSFWMKAQNAIDTLPGIQAAALSFASDFGLLATSLLTHPTTLFSENVFAASLDHAIWFHNLEALDINDWVLYQTDSPWAGSGRALTQGKIYNRQGTLIASVAQEGLVRPI